uniref:Signal peptide peptidase like 2A n=1 Tax=Paramormyrops kingsleyae TaxID=1676925 RepID=A0A3B3Q4Y4_9TELE
MTTSVSFFDCNPTEGILHVSGGSQEKEYCLVYNSSFSSISVSLNDAIDYQLVNLSSSFLCSSSDVRPNELKGKAVVVMRGNCTFGQKAQVAQDSGATTILIASEEPLVPGPVCLDAIMEKLGCATLSFSCLGKGWSGRSLLLAALCITVAVLWGVYRNEDRWIWILQDLLGIAFCLNFMKTINVSNFKICVILLSLLLIYDVFFVFITPFLTKVSGHIVSTLTLSGGKMVTVPAEPTAPFEKIPVVMRVPRFLAPNLCMMQFSILGYGDIIVPGLLVAYCHRFDVWTSSPKRIYFMSCTIAYFLGMVVTFVVMILSQMGQSALLCLVPFMLLTSGAVAWRRGEMKRFWAGTVYEVREELQSWGGGGY